MARYHVQQLALDGNDLDALVDFWREDYQTHHWTVLADPQGNEFCVGDFG